MEKKTVQYYYDMGQKVQRNKILNIIKKYSQEHKADNIEDFAERLMLKIERM